MIRIKQIITILLFCVVSNLHAVDWPMLRSNPNRTAASNLQLSDELYLSWIHHFSQREQTWDDQINNDRMRFDRLFEPIVIGKTLYIGFNDCDKVMAIDTESGEIKWTFFTDGPVRLPMAGNSDKIYFTSDDGFLYCLNAKSGNLIWKFLGTPSLKKIIGNKRLISMWPARGGVVLEDNRIYFAAGIWPFMGTFIYALNAETGQIIWKNDGTGSQYIRQPHWSPAFAGIAPQGSMAILDNKLLVSGGRSVPACFDKNTGKFEYFKFAEAQHQGGVYISAIDTFFFNHLAERDVALYNANTGLSKGKTHLGKYPTIDEKAIYYSGNSIKVSARSNPSKILFNIKVDASGDLIKSGNTLYCGGKNKITALQVNLNSKTHKIIWQKNIKGSFERLITADDKLFAITLDGKIMAFSIKQDNVKEFHHNPVKLQIAEKYHKKSLKILDNLNIQNGYALYYGIKNPDLLAAIVYNSNLNIIAIDPSVEKINLLRGKFDKAGLNGKRIHLLQGNPKTVNIPPYFAKATIIDGLKESNFENNLEYLENLYFSTRPYGGKIFIPLNSYQKHKFKEIANNSNLHGLKIIDIKNGLIISREGSLKDAGTWTHQYGNIQNTVKSDDKYVKLPMGILWFGGSSNMDVLPRHGHGPPEQIIGGKLIIQGINKFSARDVYTGQVLWKTKLDSLNTYGIYYNETHSFNSLKRSQTHAPGANSRGTNFVATMDKLYIVNEDKCYVLDMETGKKINTFKLSKKARWGYIGIYKNYLIGTSGIPDYKNMENRNEEEQKEYDKAPDWKKIMIRDFTNFNNVSSTKLFVMDRDTGELLWEKSAKYGFIHNGITAGHNILYCLDKFSPFFAKRFERRGMEYPTDYSLFALDIESGKTVWESNENIFGSWLSISEENNFLLQATRSSRDMISGEEGRRMILHNSKNGKIIWDKKLHYENPPIIHNNRIFTDKHAINLFTGELINVVNPITNEKNLWKYSRSYGCNYNIASEYLLTFRSAAAGFYDLNKMGGTGNFGGFKSSCTSNLIAADGVLNAPDYTRTCNCSYQNQTSLALIHMEDVEYWTTNDFEWSGEKINKIGINFGSAGDRIDDNNILWIDYPSIGGKSPEIPIHVIGKNVEYYRNHSSVITNIMPWVSSSGVKNFSKIQISLAEKNNKQDTYTIKLYFAELDQNTSSNFDISIQGNIVSRNINIIKESKGKNKTLIKEFNGITVNDLLEIEFHTINGTKSILSGIEIAKE